MVRGMMHETTTPWKYASKATNLLLSFPGHELAFFTKRGWWSNGVAATFPNALEQQLAQVLTSVAKLKRNLRHMCSRTEHIRFPLQRSRTVVDTRSLLFKTVTVTMKLVF